MPLTNTSSAGALKFFVKKLANKKDKNREKRITFKVLRGIMRGELGVKVLCSLFMFQNESW